MHKLVRQHAERNAPIDIINQRALSDATVVRFVMLESEVRCVIAQSQKEVIVRVMCRAKKRDRFQDDSLQRHRQLRTDLEIRRIVSRDIDLIRRISGQRNHQEVFARKHRRVDETFE